MTSLMNLGILYLLSLLTLYPFEQQPESVLIALAGALMFGFHLTPLPPAVTLFSWALIITGSFLLPHLAPFVVLPLYTVAVDVAALSGGIREADESSGGNHPVRSLRRYRNLLVAAGMSAVLVLLIHAAAGRMAGSLGFYVLVLAVLAVWLGISNARRIASTDAAAALEDKLRGMQYAQDRFQETVLVQQEQASERARLEERDRIARDVHDSVGHALTSALLQTAAIRALNEDTPLAELLEQLEQTLDQGMSETRRYLHHLEEQAADLNHELEMLAGKYSYCPVELTVRLDGPVPPALSRQITASVREALTNVSKHSGADKVSVELREFAGLYRLIIKDNGRGVPEDVLRELDSGGNIRGMGLRSLRQRAENEGGRFAVSNDSGCRIFMTFKRPGEERETISRDGKTAKG